MVPEARLGDGDPTRGWGTLAGEVEVLTVPGDHFTMVRDPQVRGLAELLARRLLGGNKART